MVKPSSAANRLDQGTNPLLEFRIVGLPVPTLLAIRTNYCLKLPYLGCSTCHQNELNISRSLQPRSLVPDLIDGCLPEAQ